MNYYIGQVLGIFTIVCCLIMPLWKKKWQMLMISAVSNIAAAFNLLPIIGVFLFMLMSFQRDEQKIRILTLFNAGTWLVYYLIVGSTVLFAELAAMITSIAAIVKYRIKKPPFKGGFFMLIPRRPLRRSPGTFQIPR